MEDKKTIKESSGAKPAAGSLPVQKIVGEIIAELPLLDSHKIQEAVEAAKERPRASARYLISLLSAKEAGMRAVSARVIASIGGASIVDDLNAIVFDAGATAYTKVLANDILTRLGSPIDRDVFNMTVPDAAREALKLPSHVTELLSAGKTGDAVAKARSLSDHERWLEMYDAANKLRAAALPFLTTLAADNEATATAAANAVAEEKIAEGVPFLLELQKDSSKEFQKLLRRLFYELRKAGVDVPEDSGPEPAAAPADTAEKESALFKSMISEPSPRGVTLVTLARPRPNGRLKVFSVVVDPYKRGISQAGLRLDMSLSAFERFVSGRSDARVKMHDASLDECRMLVARGMRVARELGMALPYDFGAGRDMLGEDLEALVDKIQDVFVCSKCGKELDPETANRIRSTAAYENMPAETRCASCRGK